MKIISRLFVVLLAFLIFGSAFADQISSTPKIQKILLVVAMDKEAEPIIKALSLQKSSLHLGTLPMQAYEGRYHNLDIAMIINGQDPIYKVQNVGTQPATLSTYLGIQHFHPNLVISIGTAGGVVEKGAKVKDIYVSDKIYFYGRRMPGQEAYGLGGYSSLKLPLLDKQADLKSVVMCSGDSFDDNKGDFQIILKQGCTTVDMEAAGVAWVSSVMKTPMFAMKGVTDYMQDKNGYAEYEKNCPVVANQLAQRLQQVLSLIAVG